MCISSMDLFPSAKDRCAPFHTKFSSILFTLQNLLTYNYEIFPAVARILLICAYLKAICCNALPLGRDIIRSEIV